MTRPAATAPAVDIARLSKTFPGQRALDDVSISVASGEVHGLLGENGSGKSTLIKILSGYYLPDPGSQVEVYGRRLEFGSSAQAETLGLRFVHQHLGIINQFTAVENVALSSGYEVDAMRRINLRAQRERTAALVARLGVEVDLRRPLGECRAIDRTVIAIARALDGLDEVRGVLVLDEPTAALPPHEVDRLFDVVRELSRTGVTTIYVSHRLDEIFDLCDRVSVLRDGQLQRTAALRDLDRAALVRMIVGRDVISSRPDLAVVAPAASSADAESPLLEIEQLRSGVLRGLSLDVRRGEIVGVAGLLGSGREEVSAAIVGAVPSSSAAIAVNGRPPTRRLTPARARALGIGMIPGNRQQGSAIGEFDVRENITLANLLPARRRGKLSTTAELATARKWINELDVRPPRPMQRFSLLSGGNQQKAILARWFNTEPAVLLVDEPTAGVDVGARQAIYEHIRGQAEQGVGFIVCSSDFEDLVELCARVIVVADGCRVGELRGTEITRDALLHATMGETA